MRRWLALAACAATMLGTRPAAAAAPDSDPRAVKVAGEVMQALGGRQKWAALEGLRWTFKVTIHDTVRSERHHTWNMHTGRYKVDGTLRTGQHFVIVSTMGDSTRTSAWLDGRAIAGDSLGMLRQRGFAMWTNDSYWFLMPYKMLDAGVHLGYGGEIQDGGRTYDRVELTFDHVGLTPGDHYWVDVDRANHRVERWEYVLQGEQPPPEKWTWEGWEQHDGLWFATAHKQEGMTIATMDVQTLSSFGPDAFRGP